MVASKARGPPLAADTADDALLSALRRGDERALPALVDRHGAAMLRFARRHAADPAVAEDVVQDAWIGVLRGLHRFEPRAALRSWIFCILLNRLRSRLRIEARTVPFSHLEDRGAGLEPACEPSQDRHLLARELHVILRRAVAGLPPLQRAVLALHDVEGWDAPSVCRRLNLTAGNQRVLLHRARVKMRQTLAPHLRD